PPSQSAVVARRLGRLGAHQGVARQAPRAAGPGAGLASLSWVVAACLTNSRCWVAGTPALCIAREALRRCSNRAKLEDVLIGEDVGAKLAENEVRPLDAAPDDVETAGNHVLPRYRRRDFVIDSEARLLEEATRGRPREEAEMSAIEQALVGV